MVRALIPQSPAAPAPPSATSSAVIPTWCVVAHQRAVRTLIPSSPTASATTAATSVTSTSPLRQLARVQRHIIRSSSTTTSGSLLSTHAPTFRLRGPKRKLWPLVQLIHQVGDVLIAALVAAETIVESLGFFPVEGHHDWLWRVKVKGGIGSVQLSLWLPWLLLVLRWIGARPLRKLVQQVPVIVEVEVACAVD